MNNTLVYFDVDSHVGGLVVFPIEHAHPHLDDPLALVHVPHPLYLDEVPFQDCHSMHEKYHVVAKRSPCACCSSLRCKIGEFREGVTEMLTGACERVLTVCGTSESFGSLSQSAGPTELPNGLGSLVV